MRRRVLWIGGSLLVAAGVVFFTVKNRTATPEVGELVRDMTLTGDNLLPAWIVSPGTTPLTPSETQTYTIRRSFDDVSADARKLLSGGGWSQPVALQEKAHRVVTFLHAAPVSEFSWGRPGTLIVTLRPGKAVLSQENVPITLTPQKEPWTTVTVESGGRPLTKAEQWFGFLRPKVPSNWTHSPNCVIMPAPIRKGGPPVWPF